MAMRGAGRNTRAASYAGGKLKTPYMKHNSGSYSAGYAKYRTMACIAVRFLVDNSIDFYNEDGSRCRGMPVLYKLR